MDITYIRIRPATAHVATFECYTIDKLESGGLSIVDYKTSKELFTIDDLEEDLQLTLYQLAAEQTWQLPVEKLTLYHLRSNTACSCPPRDEARLEQAKQLVLEVAESIARQIFPAIENQYCPCDFPEHCPYYRHQYMVATPVPARQELLPGIAAVDAIERYASLHTEIKEWSSRRIMKPVKAGKKSFQTNVWD